MRILWSSEIKLVWDGFKGIPDTDRTKKKVGIKLARLKKYEYIPEE